MWEHLIGPGTLKAGLKAADALTGGAFHGAVDVMEEITSSPAYTKHRIDQAQDTLSDFWDDHKDDVEDFFDNVGEKISDGWDSFTENVGEVAEGIGDAISEHGEDILDAVGGLFGALFSS